MKIKIPYDIELCVTPLVNDELAWGKDHYNLFRRGKVIEGDGDVRYEEGCRVFDLYILHGRWAGIIWNVKREWIIK